MLICSNKTLSGTNYALGLQNLYKDIWLGVKRLFYILTMVLATWVHQSSLNRCILLQLHLKIICIFWILNHLRSPNSLRQETLCNYSLSPKQGALTTSSSRVKGGGRRKPPRKYNQGPRRKIK